MIRTLFVALVLVCSTVQGQTVSELKAHVEYLASDELAGRYPASDGMQKAKDYVRAECKTLGLETYTQDVRVKGGTCQNIIAVLPGRGGGQRIVIGAHLDHIGGGTIGRVHNGADDNASGSAGVLALAKRLVAGSQLSCTVEFHWYTGEEQGLLGSKTYCKKPLAPIEDYVCMVNLDMVGRMKTPGMWGERPQRGGLDLDEILEPLYVKYDFAENITWARDTEDSDHSSWWKVDVPAVILHTGLHKDYHRPTDDANKINYAGMVEVCHYALDIVMAVDRKFGGVVTVPEEPFTLY